MRQDTATISRAILHCSWSENAQSVVKQTVVKRSSCPFGVGACRPQARIGLAKFTVQLLYPGWHINLNCRFRNCISQSIVLEVFPSATFYMEAHRKLSRRARRRKPPDSSVRHEIYGVDYRIPGLTPPGSPAY